MGERRTLSCRRSADPSNRNLGHEPCATPARSPRSRVRLDSLHDQSSRRNQPTGAAHGPRHRHSIAVLVECYFADDQAHRDRASLTPGNSPVLLMVSLGPEGVLHVEEVAAGNDTSLLRIGDGGRDALLERGAGRRQTSSSRRHRRPAHPPRRRHRHLRHARSGADGPSNPLRSRPWRPNALSVDVRRALQSSISPSMRVTVPPPIQIVPSSSWSTCTRPAPPEGACPGGRRTAR